MHARPSMDETLLDVALIMSKRSTCPRKHVGAVISRDGRVIATGYNGPPAGMPHCEHSDDEPCNDAVHAEANAIAFAARHGVATDRAMLTTTMLPCLKCSQLTINAGIVAVTYLHPYRDSSGATLLERAGITVVEW